MPTEKKSFLSNTAKESTNEITINRPLREQLLLLLAEHPDGLTRHEIVKLGIPNGARKTAREEERRDRDIRVFERVRKPGVRGDIFRITSAGEKEVAKLRGRKLTIEGHLPELAPPAGFKRPEVRKTFPLAIDIDAPPPGRAEYKNNRIIRDTATARALKELYEHRCQMCDVSVCNGIYSEAHHIRPLGGNHAGPDNASNILVLCPDHHALCDLALITLDLEILRSHPEHQISQDFIDYHNRMAEARKRGTAQ